MAQNLLPKQVTLNIVVMQNTRKTYYPQPQGLYESKNEHDACGVGMIADINGRVRHNIVEGGIKILERLMHRGAVGGDSKTGDGAGILVQIPDEFFRSRIAELPELGKYAVSMNFLPREPELAARCTQIFDECAASEGFCVIARRIVPTDPSVLGEIALKSMPTIEQVFLKPLGEYANTADLERKLYVLRRVIENAVESKTDAGDTFYICSLSCRTVVYKGLLNAPQMRGFFPDLADESFKSALAIIHQRYSTNTFPTWQLAQPFRYLAHNGEINTLRGNLNQMRSRQNSFDSPLFNGEFSKILPAVRENQSDSACLDNAVELYYSAGRSLPHTMLMLVPQAWGNSFDVSKDIHGFFEYNSCVSEPWDGPAALAFTDGVNAGALLDRNGLRPARYSRGEDGTFVLASEEGVYDYGDVSIIEHGRLGAGQMIYLDMENHRIVKDTEIKTLIAREKPYRRWVDENMIKLSGIFESVPEPTVGKNLIQRQKLFGYTAEDLDIVLRPMAENGVEPVGSMGNDAALAVLSEKPQLLYDYFKQLFAQVTNPPIDPIRERLVMSTMTYIGSQGNTLVDVPEHCRMLKLPHPILANRDVSCLCASKVPYLQAERIVAQFSAVEGAAGLEKSLEELCQKAEDAVRLGKCVIIISDKNLDYGRVPIPMLLAVAAVNRRLIEKNLRTKAGIVAETGEAREVSHIVLLLGYGATAINPYLAFETIADMVESGRITKVDAATAVDHYIKALCKGLLKVMSKMGISTLRSYRQAQVFEAIGLGKELVNKYFAPTASRVGGIGLPEIAAECLERYHNSHYPQPNYEHSLENIGKYKFRKNGEHHLWTPQTITLLQRAVREGDEAKYREYAQFINDQSHHLCTLRGLFQFAKTTPIPIEEVEDERSIVRRFVTGAMSFGSISPEAHETIAIAMNRLGGMSNCGEGGEDPARFKTVGTDRNTSSAIKQVASGRFGVTAEYLANAKELQIKIAQGAKPGEGGQLLGYKVNEIIARVRHATAGVTLISPPPHHDIYSIEDLAQLIYDLRNANKDARISVKLVSEVGVGTVAAGVAKAKADVVLISGHDGGTGASPLTSIKYAGMPWELGIAEAQQTLRLNGLRDKIRIQVDGQLKTGRDVVIGALLGAEEFGFATTILVTLGCVMMRKCHDNSCPVGVATQDPRLRKCFKGKPEHVENFLLFIAREVREILASLGLHSLDEAVGRTDLLETEHAINFWKAKNLDFSQIFAGVGDETLPRKSAGLAPRDMPQAYDNALIAQVGANIDSGKPIEISAQIRNSDRTAGAMLSNLVAKKYGNKGLPEDTITVNFKGVAGQSFGAFLAAGITFNLEGEANDYLGKGLSGGKITVRFPEEAKFDASSNVIAGNVIGYGATGGKIFLSGRVGERFAIRNSGATFVMEGSGDHCCEYMTGGVVVCLGDAGFNFGAGMTGGFAYVLDSDGRFDMRCNLQSIDLESIVEGSEDESRLLALIGEFQRATGSKRAAEILSDWNSYRPKFVKVFPVEYRNVLNKKNA